MFRQAVQFKQKEEIMSFTKITFTIIFIITQIILTSAVAFAGAEADNSITGTVWSDDNMDNVLPPFATFKLPSHPDASAYNPNYSIGPDFSLQTGAISSWAPRSSSHSGSPTFTSQPS